MTAPHLGPIDLDLPRGARVVVAMSGGVDSSVVAALLARDGYEVVGVTLQLYDHGAASVRAKFCCAGRDVADARAVAARLGIAHYVLDFEARFKAAVIDEFADAYAAGRTPVPCIRCNERVKFRDLLDIARDLGAAALATGHYARRRLGPDGPELHRGRDLRRDQSYFLFATTKDQLAYLRFPLGDLDKPATRALARELGLAVAEKPDSQDICFVPHGDHAALVHRLRPEAAVPGDILGQDGTVLGRHDGVARFTVGQRRGLGVAAGHRLYVTALDAGRASVPLGPRGAGLASAATLQGINWLGSAPIPAAGRTLEVKHRANEAAVAARIMPLTAGGGQLVFAAEQSAVAPGQAAVFYDGDQVLGGGWIEGVVPAGLTPTEAVAVALCPP